jgi:hypothetical protein
MILTDAVIEKAARALANNAIGTKGECLEQYVIQASAALEAVLPDIIEACAKVAEGVPSYAHDDDFSNGVDSGRANAAEDIRSLSPKQKD